jgi:hypothetical protein
MQSHYFQQSVAANERHKCASRSCGNTRKGINCWCSKCLDKALRYGHPEAPPLRPSLWNTERQQVQQLLAPRASHPGLQSALSSLDGWSARAMANARAFKGAEEVARVARHGITSLHLLTEVAAFHVWLNRNPRALPDDDEARDFAMSRAVFALAPRPRRFTGHGARWPGAAKMTAENSYATRARTSGLRYVGQHLRQVLSPILANISVSLEQRARQEAERQAAMRAPLWPPEAA